jgi:hypothetical protein
MRIVLVVLFCSMAFCVVRAQNAEVLLEDLSQSEGFSVHDLEEMLQTRSNLNAATQEDLELLGFLTPYQVASLLDYKNRYGLFFTWQEVLLIPGFSEEDTELLSLFFTSNPCRKIRRKRNGLVQGICMQALGMSQGSSHSFCTSTGYVVKGVLFGK